MSRIVIPGGSGFLGRALTARLVGRGDEVVILGRGESQHVEGARTVAWDAESIGPWASELDGLTPSCTSPAGASTCAAPSATSTS